MALLYLLWYKELEFIINIPYTLVTLCFYILPIDSNLGVTVRIPLSSISNKSSTTMLPQKGWYSINCKHYQQNVISEFRLYTLAHSVILRRLVLFVVTNSIVTWCKSSRWLRDALDPFWISTSLHDRYVMFWTHFGSL